MEMAEDKQPIIVTESDETLGGFVLKTAFSTVKWILITVALATTLFCCLFPYQTMIMYRSLGNYSKALDYCDVCIKQSDDKEGSEYAALLVNGINMSAKLLSDQTKPAYADVKKDKLRSAAEKVVGYTDRYISLPDDVRRAQSKAVNEYNITNTDRALHTQVYNFEAYARTERILALSFCGNSADVSVILADFFIADFLMDNGMIDINEMIVMAAEVNAYLDFERYRLALKLSDPGGEKQKVKGAYGIMTESWFNGFADNIGYAFEKAESLTGLDKLYAVETLAILADNLYAATYGYDYSNTKALADETKQACLNAKTVKVNGEETTLLAYYNLLYLVYISVS